MQAPTDDPFSGSDLSVGEIIQFERHARMLLPLYMETVAAGRGIGKSGSPART